MSDRPAFGRADGRTTTLLTATALSFLLVGLPAPGAAQAAASAGDRATSGTADPQAMTVTRGGSQASFVAAPALERYTRAALLGDVWKRPELSPRDRSLVTVAALVARGQTQAMPDEVVRALDNGVTPAEISEILTHLAFYCGRANATSAAAVVKDVFTARGVTMAELPPASGGRLPLDEAAERQRAARVERLFGPVAPGVVKYTTELLFRDLWLRPALAPRDRSLVTVSALVATGQPEQLRFHLDRAMDEGLTRVEASEVLTQLAFYAGWPKVFSALPVVKDVFERRP